MLTLRDSSGVDLAAVPPPPLFVALTTQRGTPYTITVYGIEDDPAIAPQYVSGTINWNDGVNVDKFSYASTSNGTLALSAQQMLTPGYHNLGVYIHNYRAPVANAVQVNFSVTVLEPASNSESLRYLYGPILPKDTGYPNPSQWNFNLGADLAVLASSVKMLVETQIGERVMQPGYGTDIRAVLFDPMVPGVETLIMEKVTQALTQWEPRVGVSGVVVSRSSDRSVSLYLTLVSHLTQQEFQVLSNFTA